MFRIGDVSRIRRALVGPIVRLVPLALFSLGALAAIPGTSRAAPMFPARFMLIDVGGSPLSVATGDLNQDGKPDLVAGSNGNVSTVLGNGDGTFGSPNILPVVGESVAIGDLNGDGRPDLVVGSYSRLASMLLGNGDGTFGAPIDLPVGGGITAIADLNVDGKLDLVKTTGAGPSVLLGNGDGTFGAPLNLPFNVSLFEDLNHDGKPDLVGHSEREALVALGNGDGTFGAERAYSVEDIPIAVAIGDLNGDGNPDLITENYNVSLSVFLGNGDGSFGAETICPGGGAMSVALVDLNGDGKLDVAQGGRYDGAVSVMLGNGNGTFGASRAYAGNFPRDCWPHTVTAGDVSGDGKADLVVTLCSTKVLLLLGNGDGTFGTQHVYGSGITELAEAIADLNEDGKPDVAATSDAGASVLLGAGDGTFSAISDYATGSIPWSLAIADLNRDGHSDLAVVNNGSNRVSVLLGRGDGTFGAKRDYATGGNSRSVAVGDFNGDGKLDLAVSNLGANTLWVRLGNGDGTFGVERSFPTGIGPSAMAVGDLNGDGLPDLAAANQGTWSNPAGTVSVLLGSASLILQPTGDFATGGAPVSVAIGDLNRDGKPDLAVANSSDNTVSVLLGRGDGTFGPKSDYLTWCFLTFVAIGDMNGDGKPDLVVVNAGGHTIGVGLGNGDGSFSPTTDYGFDGDTYSAAIGDLNRDGKLDLAAPSGRGIVALINASGDVVTPIALALVDAHAEPGRAELSWYGASMAAVSATVYRQSEGAPWTAVASIAGDGAGMLRFEDLNVRPGVRYGYRLGVRAGGAEEFYGEAWILVPGGWTIALAAPAPNPVTERLTIGFVLPSTAPARLEVVDVGGRLMTRRDVGALGAGLHHITFSEAAQWRPGIYLVRLTQGPHSLIARACIVR